MFNRAPVFSRLAGSVLTLSSEEARTAIKALERSAQAMPDPTETLGSREVREKRERKLAAAIRLRIGNTLG